MQTKDIEEIKAQRERLAEIKSQQKETEDAIKVLENSELNNQINLLKTQIAESKADIKNGRQELNLSTPIISDKVMQLKKEISDLIQKQNAETSRILNVEQALRTMEIELARLQSMLV